MDCTALMIIAHLRCHCRCTAVGGRGTPWVRMRSSYLNRLVVVVVPHVTHFETPPNLMKTRSKRKAAAADVAADEPPLKKSAKGVHVACVRVRGSFAAV